MACKYTYRVILNQNDNIFDLIIDFIHPDLLGGHFPSEAATAPVAFTFHRDRCAKVRLSEKAEGVKRATLP